jgi:hypothetical protein
MLTELSDLQESDERVWSCAEVSFTIQTRSDDDGEIVERDYTFSHAPEWDMWSFTEFEERRAKDSTSVANRNWRRTRHILWDNIESTTINVPQEVEKKLEELLGLEQLVIQNP